MPTPRPNTSRKFIVALAVVCSIAALGGWSAMKEMRQNDLDEQLFTAIQHGDTSELTPLLDQGADPNFSPRSGGDEIGLGALITNLRHGRIALHVNHGPPVIGYVLNGFSKERPMPALRAKTLKAQHILLTTAVTCTDPIGKLRVLLDHHADPNRNYMGINPLTHAVGESQANAVQLLLKYGANPDAQTESGNTARKYANLFNSKAVLSLLNTKTENRK